MKKLTLLYPLLFLLACSSAERETFAHITQRRIKTGGRLVISYQFSDGKKLFSDSSEVVNRVVPHDSVKVAYSLVDPGSSRLLLP